VGFVFQDYHLFPLLTTAENVAIPLLLKKREWNVSMEDGMIAGLVSAYVSGTQEKPLPPAFSPAPNPYVKGIYTTGIIESYQSSGENINIYPEVSGVIKEIPVTEGQIVKQGTPLILMDESVQRALVEQQKSQADAALAWLQELKAQPRKENLEVSRAQVEYANAGLANVQSQLQFQQARLGYLQAQAQRFLDTTALFVALGGSWWSKVEE
jgi:multidrug efflux pump subunit AcrA (membrane-fusion protein)